MKNNNQILKHLDFERFVKTADSQDLSKEQSIFINKEVVGKVDIDGVHFSTNYATIYFKTISSFDTNSLVDISKLHKTIWNQRKVPFLYVSAPTEIRVYNCLKEPVDPDKDLKKIDDLELARYSVNDTKEHLEELVDILSREAVDSGRIWKNDEFTRHFETSRSVDSKLVQNLKEAKAKLEKRRISIDTIHNLLTRSLFILYLEDIGATENSKNSNKKYFENFKTGATSYFEILNDRNATYKLYNTFEKKFNGDLFAISEVEKETVAKEDLNIIASCFWGNELNTGQQSLWRMFDFSVIPIELLSEIYEIFLNKTDKEKSKSGEYYTPHSLVDLILNESLPWANQENSKFDLKILDIACGSGIFLVESYRRLVDRWMFSHNKQPEFKDLEKILLGSIFGFEINKSSIKVAAFSLYLALISYLDPKTIWQQKTTKFPYLIFDPENKDENTNGKNLYLQSSLSNIIEQQPKFDLVVGNPPFKSARTGSIEPEASRYCEDQKFAQEMVLPFLHRASYFCNDNGRVAIVSTSKILFNKSGGYRNFRRFLFKENYVDTVFNFSALRKPKKGQGKSMFAHAVGPSCVLFYRKNRPEQISDTISYLCPKPTERDRFTEELILDELDFSYLPRAEAEKASTLIWKVSMWATDNDYQLITNIVRKKTLNEFFNKENGWIIGGGFKFLTLTKDTAYEENAIKKLPILESKFVERYHSSHKALQHINKTLTNKNIPFYLNYYRANSPEDLPPIDLFRHPGKIKTYYAPHLLIKEGQSKKRFSSSFINFDCCFKHTITGISFNKEIFSDSEINRKTELLKALTAFFNSRFASYFLFLTSISWGVERERVTAKNLFELPALPFEVSNEIVNNLANKLDEITEELKKDFRNHTAIEKLENEIDEIVYSALNLTERDRYLIEDVLTYSLDLFQEGENSKAYYPVNQYNDELNDYLTILGEDINEHFEFSGTTVWTSIQAMPATNPMRLVAIHFTKENKPGKIKTFSNSIRINKLIRKIDEYSYEKYSASVYSRKIVKYYDGDVIYIIKPNQKRFWSRSQAMQDSSSILLEMANISDE